MKNYILVLVHLLVPYIATELARATAILSIYFFCDLLVVAASFRISVPIPRERLTTISNSSNRIISFIQSSEMVQFYAK